MKMLWVYSKDFSRKLETSVERGDIYDRSGLLLATNISTKSICCDPARTPKKYNEMIKKRFNIDLQEYRDNKKQFLWLERHVKDSTLEEVKNIPGINVKNDYLREYPFWKITANIIGFCDQNFHGKHGVEYAMDKDLSQTDVRLSLDINMQALLYKILTVGTRDFAAEGASGLIIDMDLGRIRAMVSIPSPMVKLDFLDHRFRNRNLDPVEVGSVMKLLNIAIALESGQYTPDSLVDARGPLILDKFEVNDLIGVDREMTLSESLWSSSNIVNARVALQLGKKLQKKFFRKIGLFEKLEWMPRCYAHPLPPRQWGETTTATLGYGYGLGVTALHLAKMVFAISTGKTMNLSILEDPQQKSSKMIFSPETVKEIKKMMREVITKSYRKTLLIRGCRVGAKTGTANLLVNGKYLEGRNFVTLVAIFPLKKPQLMIILQMNDPKKEFLKQGRYTTAGNVLSKYMREIIQTIHEKRMNVK